MPQIKRFFECLVPVTACNLRCEYCYVMQLGGNSGKMAGFKYPVAQMSRALSQERLGGVCFFSFCGAGETLFHPDLSELVALLLEEGHYVNITTNGTYTKGVNRLLELVCAESRRHLLLSFSLHWLELQNKGLTSVFAENVKAVRNAGCSIVVQFNLYDGYLAHLDEIKEYCMSNFGALPQVAATRREEGKITLHTSMSKAEYERIGREFDSPLFEFTMKNFNRTFHNFCYAGDWSWVMNLERGTIKSCYCNGVETDIFANPETPFPSECVGVFCRHAYCVNSSHFLSLGVIPSVYQNITYAGLRNRSVNRTASEDCMRVDSWLSDDMQSFLSQKLSTSNLQKSTIAKVGWTIQEAMLMFRRFILRKVGIVAK